MGGLNISGVKRLLFCVWVLLLAPGAGAWHAFLERGVAPEVPETSLRPDLITFPGSAKDVQKASLTHKCTIGLTSVAKAAKVCEALHASCASNCSGSCLACATSLNSAVRDAHDMLDLNCYEVEVQLNTILTNVYANLGALNTTTFSLGEDATFSYSDFAAIRGMCYNVTSYWLSPCTGKDFCDPFMAPIGVDGENTAVSLAPSDAECSNFVVSQAGNEYSFLTWGLLRRYTRENLGCSGGLKQLTEPEYKSWSCIHQPDCTQLAKDDMACFKYNEMRGEFHFWGWNSQLNLHPPLFQVRYRLCNKGVFAWTRADTGLPVHLNESGTMLPVSLKIRIKNDESVPGDTVWDFDPIYSSLGGDGCGYFDLRQNTDFWVEASLGDDYYAWNGWWTSGSAVAGAESRVLDLSFAYKEQYNAETCTRGTSPNDWMLRFTLNWCEQEHIDLDMYFVGQEGDGGQEVSWKWPMLADWEAEDSAYTVNLELDDVGLDRSTGERSFGPETIYVRGSLPVGMWRVMVNVYPTLSNGEEDTLSPHEAYSFISQCASVNFFASMMDTPAASVKMLSPGSSPGEATDWWHVLTLEVSHDGTLSFVVVDQFIQGPDPRNQYFEMWKPESGLSNPDKLAIMAPDGKSCQLFYTIGLLARHATTLEFVAGSFSVDCPPEFCPSAQCCADAKNLQDAVQRFDAIKGQVTGGVQLPQSTAPGHEYRVDVISEGFATSVFYFFLREDRRFTKNVYMIPEEGGSTFLVLNWGDKPRDLDSYVFPIRIRNVDPVSPPSAPLGRDEISPDPEGYVTWHANPEVDIPDAVFPTLPYRDQYGIPSKDHFVNWQQDRLQWRDVSDGPYVRPRFPCVGTAGICINLARTDYEHGLLIDGFVNNAPEILSFTHLPKGKYRYFINVFQGPWGDDWDTPELNVDNYEFLDPLNVDVWIGDSNSTVTLGAATQWDEPGGKWLYVGYFQVIEDMPGDNCDLGVAQKGRNLGTCIVWHTVNELAELNPVSFNNFEVRLRFLTLPGEFPEDFYSVSWVAHRGGSCSCLGSKVCRCEGGYVFDKGLLGRVTTMRVGDTSYKVNQNPFHLEEGMYWIVFSKAGFYDRAVQVHVGTRDMHPDESDVVLMVEEAPNAGARVVLNDGAIGSVGGHNMFLVSTNGARDRIIWKAQTESGSNSPVFSHSSLSNQLIDFGFTTRGLTWAVAVHNPMYLTTSQSLDKISVEIYDSKGLVSDVQWTEVSEWWNVGFVQKLPTGIFLYNSPEAGTSDDCSAVFADTVSCAESVSLALLDVSFGSGMPGTRMPCMGCTGCGTYMGASWSISDGSASKDYYSSNADCKWIFTASDPTATTKITFTLFDLQPVDVDDGDFYDWVEVWECETSACALGSVRLIDQISGFRSAGLEVYGSTNVMMVVFKTNYDIEYAGFEAQFSEVPENICSGCAGCGTFMGTSWSISDGSGSNDYSSNADCEWIFVTSDPTSTAMINFDFFDLEPVDVDDGTIYDWVEVWECDTSACFQPRQIGDRISGTQLAGLEVYGSTNVMMVVFKTDNDIEYAGFEATFLEVPDVLTMEDADMCSGCTGCGTHMNTSWSISDGSGSKDYSSNADCEWIFVTSDPTSTAMLNFTLIELEPADEGGMYDWLEVWECDTVACTNRVQLYQPTGSMSYAGLPFWEIYASTSVMMVAFKSDGDIEYAGFEATFKEVRQDDLRCTSCLVDFAGFEFNTHEGDIDAVCNVVADHVSCQNTIVSGTGLALSNGAFVNKTESMALSTEKLHWETVFPLYLVDMKKILFLEFPAQRGYLASVIKIVASETNGEVVSDFVRQPCASCMTIVLRWGTTVLDLDVHVFKDSDPSSPTLPSSFPTENDQSPDDMNRLYWGSMGGRTKWGGVTYAAWDDAYYGPESVIFDQDTENGRYQLVVNPFQSTSPNNVVPTSAVVSVYTVEGLVMNLQPPSEIQGWYVGNIIKQGSTISWSPVNQLTNKLSNSDLPKQYPTNNFVYETPVYSSGSSSGTSTGSIR